jgi:uncharacterized protein YndB with AHSA1/START domain
MVTTKLGDSVVKKIFIECRPETLFSFFTDPEKMTQWMGRYVLLEPKIGGQFRIDINGSDVVLGKYVELIPNKKVVITWGWINSAVLPPGSSTVEFQLRAKDNGTLLILTHSGLPAIKMPTHLEGWKYYTARLQAVVLGRDPGPDTFSKPLL